MVRVFVLVSKLNMTSSPSLRSRDSLNSLGITNLPRVSSRIIEFIFLQPWEICGNIYGRCSINNFRSLFIIHRKLQKEQLC